MFSPIVLLALSMAIIAPGAPAGCDSARAQLDSALRTIRVEATVAAPIERVWDAWTTPSGLATFFAPRSRVELRVFGPYEILFDPDAPAGQRGAEGNVILALEPRSMLAFTWDAPGHLPKVRAQRTSVVVGLTSMDSAHTRVTLTQSGFAAGGEWDEAFTYFGRAWPYVLNQLMRSFESPPTTIAGARSAC